jgi:hypothetical protein
MICYPKNGVSVEPKYSVLLTTRVSRTLNFRAHIPVLSSTAIARGQSRNMEGLARSANSRAERGRTRAKRELSYAFEYDRAGTVLALAIQYSRRHVRKELRGESFHVLESSQVLITSACLKTTLFTFSEYNRLLFIRQLYGYN